MLNLDPELMLAFADVHVSSLKLLLVFAAR